MKKIIIISLLSVLITSCVVPYSSYDTPRYIYHPHVNHHRPTKVIVIKQKKHNKKRHIKVKINKHRKTK
jgi:hypothetical protein